MESAMGSLYLRPADAAASARSASRSTTSPKRIWATALSAEATSTCLSKTLKTSARQMLGTMSGSAAKIASSKTSALPLPSKNVSQADESITTALIKYDRFHAVPRCQCQQENLSFLPVETRAPFGAHHQREKLAFAAPAL